MFYFSCSKNFICVMEDLYNKHILYFSTGFFLFLYSNYFVSTEYLYSCMCSDNTLHTFHCFDIQVYRYFQDLLTHPSDGLYSPPTWMASQCPGRPAYGVLVPAGRPKEYQQSMDFSLQYCVSLREHWYRNGVFQLILQ